MEFSRQEYSSGWSSRPRDQTWVSHIAGRCFTIWATREALQGQGRAVLIVCAAVSITAPSAFNLFNLLLFRCSVMSDSVGWFMSFSKTNIVFVFQLLSHAQLFATPWTAAHQAFSSFTISWSLLKFMSFESVMPSNRLILYHPLLLLPSFFPSIRVFSNESAVHIRWPK